MINAKEFLIDFTFGENIPELFIRNYYSKEGWFGCRRADIETCRIGPVGQLYDYQEAWKSIKVNARREIDDDGITWLFFLAQIEGDLWACCPDLMTPDEYVNFFGENPKSTPIG